MEISPFKLFQKRFEHFFDICPSFIFSERFLHLEWRNLHSEWRFLHSNFFRSVSNLFFEMCLSFFPEHFLHSEWRNLDSEWRKISPFKLFQKRFEPFFEICLSFFPEHFLHSEWRNLHLEWRFLHSNFFRSVSNLSFLKNLYTRYVFSEAFSPFRMEKSPF